LKWYGTSSGLSQIGHVNKHRQLIAWQRCRELTREVYRAVAVCPRAERYGLSSQLCRASVSATANMAEGYARFGSAEFAHALSVALGSLAEVETLLQVASDPNYLETATYERLEALRDEASRVTYALQRKVRR
jgi:four helix bundle protein